MVGAVPTVTGAGGGEEPDGDGLPVALKDFMVRLCAFLGVMGGEGVVFVYGATCLRFCCTCFAAPTWGE